MPLPLLAERAPDIGVGQVSIQQHDGANARMNLKSDAGLLFRISDDEILAGENLFAQIVASM